MPKHFNRNRPLAWSNNNVFIEQRSNSDRDRDRRVTFKNNRDRPDRRDKDWSNAIRAHLEDEDIDMGIGPGSSKNVRFNKNKNRGGGGGRGRQGSPAPIQKRKLLEGPSSWYKVTLPHGDKYDKTFILKTLLDKLAPTPFWPISWQVYGTQVNFYVDDFKAAQKLNNLDRQIQLPNGFKLLIRVFAGTPNVEMTDSLKEKIKLTMAKRYNAPTKALDLTKFHADPDLQNYFCALFKPIVFLAVIEIIAENIPDLEALNLYDNKIQLLNFLKKLDKKIPNLKILHIGNNKIRDITELDAFQGLPVVDLLLDGNPVCDKFKDKPTYISEVRKRFPKCMKLDGVDLPPPISFDIAEEQPLPPCQQTFLCNGDGGSIVRQFLELYFVIYDSDNRQSLLQAYHEKATFSMTMAYPYGYSKDSKGVSWLNWYATDNRNLLRVQDPDRRNKLLRQGQVAVVSFLQDMPHTKHDIHSFTVDLTVFTPQMLCLTVAGMFKELKSGHKVPPLRYFFRTLVIVPAGSGFCIANEELHISNATPDQAKDAFKTTVNVAPAPAPVITSPGPSIPQPAVPDDATKQEMVKQMSAVSGMNLEWSLQCLEETQWDYQKAIMVFQNLNAQGVVPQAAFIK
ncbi:nuclear RNA export factor 1 isoform X1 [Diabrotica virgifera virgifera]|uniref:Nuclear RNA export factor 1-like n=1 Tax=Diabrotica virgifera virgifera TaxID=50390 RepID=A0A6P7F0S7_DIAVI|nr:nuclear RNA export factor 1 isoform X1 [Diabrotica virgifera virgifera]